MTPRVYFDACCLNRPFDDPGQLRIRLEADAVVTLLRAAEVGLIRWVASDVLRWELGRCPDTERRDAVSAILDTAAEHAATTRSVLERARSIAAKGVGVIDATHLAVAEAAGIDVLLTTDDDFRRRAGRLRPKSLVRVENPVSFAEEVLR